MTATGYADVFVAAMVIVADFLNGSVFDALMRASRWVSVTVMSSVERCRAESSVVLEGAVNSDA